MRVVGDATDRLPLPRVNAPPRSPTPTPPSFHPRLNSSNGPSEDDPCRPQNAAMQPCSSAQSPISYCYLCCCFPRRLLLLLIAACHVYLYCATRFFSLSWEAPTSSATFTPSLYTWKVGMAVMPHASATACGVDRTQAAVY